MSNQSTKPQTTPYGRPSAIARHSIRLLDAASAELESAIARTKNEMATNANLYRRGNINFSEWQIRQAESVKRINLIAYAEKRGGLSNLTPRDLGKVGSAIKSQYAYLNQFALQVEGGLDIDSARFIARASSYAESARITGASAEREVQREGGAAEERRVLNPGESCEDCIEYAAQGWAAVGELPDIGQESACGQNCNCEFEYR